MRLILLLLFALPAWADYGVITGDTSGSVEASVSLSQGCGTLRLSKTGDGSGADDDFGSGTVTLKEYDEEGNWSSVTTYTEAPDPITQDLNFGGTNVSVGVHMGSSSSPDLYWQITEGQCRR